MATRIIVFMTLVVHVGVNLCSCEGQYGFVWTGCYGFEMTISISLGILYMLLFSVKHGINIIEDFENASSYICTFLANRIYAIEKLLAGFNMQPRICMNQSLI